MSPKRTQLIHRLAHQAAKGEQGVALVMTLSVLSLLVVIGLSYAYTSISAQKTVEYSQNLIKSRLVNESGFSRAYEFLASEFGDEYDVTSLFPATKAGRKNQFGPTFSGSTSSEWAGRYYWASYDGNLNGADSDPYGLDTPMGNYPSYALNVRLGDVDFVPKTSFYPSVSASDSYGWIHVYDSSETYPAGDTPIIARVAYLIIDESGKVDPTAICYVDTEEGSEVRKGAQPHEIDLGNVLNDSALATKFQPLNHWDGATDGSYLPVYYEGTLVRDDKSLVNGIDSSDTITASKWHSYYNIFRGFKRHEPAIWTSANRANVVNNIFPYSYEIEAYFNGNTDQHRFVLVRDDWVTMRATDVVKGAQSFWGDTTDTEERIKDNNGGIPWLNNSSDTDKDFVYQIAANLIDYSDTDLFSTTDFPGEDPPSYTGNDKTPYINEFALTIKINGITGMVDSVMAAVELVEMYGRTFDDSAHTNYLKIDFTMETNPDAGIGDVTLTKTFNTNSVLSDSDYSSTITTSFNPGLLIPGTTEISFSDITIKYLESSSGSDLLDYARIPDTDTPLTIVPASFAGVVGFRSYNWEIDDPRHNLDTDLWSWVNSDPDGDGERNWFSGIYIGEGTFTSKNSVCSLGEGDKVGSRYYNVAGAVEGTRVVDGLLPFNKNGIFGEDTTERYMDIEQARDSGEVQPWTVSTAYIRNAPMESLWELGAIHRAAPWQTINIHSFDTRSGKSIQFMSNEGIDDDDTGYRSGDAHILSQVKLTEDEEVEGKININTYNTDVLRGLLQDITVGGTYADPASASGTKLTAADALAIIGSSPFASSSDSPLTILGANGSGRTTGGNAILDPDDNEPYGPFRFRGEVAKASYLTLSDAGIFPGTGAGIGATGILTTMTDRKQEEIIGKIANMLTVRMNYFTVITSSQVVKDMITGFRDGQRGKFDPPKWIGPEVDDVLHVDRVLTGQKIMAVYYRDALRNQYKVVRYEYLDE